ncbi:MAG: hypothetical protein WC069_05965 [Candidatus Shapirobacteria bacterium]
MTHNDKSKKTQEDQADLLGMKPFSSIGPDRDTEETKSVVDKLKKKKLNSTRAEGSTEEDGQKANLDKMTGAIGNFVNRK